jgi:hypothetical protein
MFPLPREADSAAQDHRARDNSSPADAPAAPEKHPKLGRPTAKWTYRDGAGAKSVAIVSPPADASVGWDAAEADDGHTSAALAWCAQRSRLMLPLPPAAAPAEERLSAIR